MIRSDARASPAAGAGGRCYRDNAGPATADAASRGGRGGQAAHSGGGVPAGHVEEGQGWRARQGPRFARRRSMVPRDSAPTQTRPLRPQASRGPLPAAPATSPSLVPASLTAGCPPL
eukprot:1149422-Prymnesium_polylepis.1